MQLGYGIAGLWRRLEAAALIQPLAWELPYASGATLKRPPPPKKRREKEKKIHHIKRMKGNNPHHHLIDAKKSI